MYSKTKAAASPPRLAGNALVTVTMANAGFLTETGAVNLPGIRPQDIADRLGFPYPSRPHPLDPLQKHPRHGVAPGNEF
jgi:hypothetical protein